MKPVTNPSILEQLEGKPSGGLKPVTDPNILSQLEQPKRQEPDFEAMIAGVKKPMVDLSGMRQGDINFLAKLDQPSENAPEWARKSPVAYTAATRAKDLLSPTAQALSFYGGLGVGGSTGAGLASSMEQNLENTFDVYMGRKPQPSMLENFTNAARDFSVSKTLQDVSQNLGNIKDYIPQKVKDVAVKILPKKATPEALEAEKQARSIGAKLLPSDIKQSKSLAQIEAGMGRLLGSSSLLQNEDKKNILAIINEAKGIVDKSGSPTNQEDLGRLIYDKVDDYLTTHANYDKKRLETIRNIVKRQTGSSLNPVKLSENAAGAIQESNKAMYDKGQDLYSKRNKLIPKEGVPLNTTLATAEKWDKALSKRPPTEVDSMLRNRVKEIISLSKQESLSDVNTLESLWEKPIAKRVIPKADLNILSEFKSNINADMAKINPAMKYGIEGIKGATRPGASLESRAYAELANAMERDINAYSRASGSGLTEANRAAINYWREFRQSTNDKDFARILSSKPNEILDKINDLSDVRAVKRVIGEDKFNKYVKPAFTNKIFGTGAEAFSPEESTKAIVKYSNVIPSVYSQDEIKLMEKAIKLGDIVNTRLEHIDKQFLKGLIRAQDPRVIVDSVFTGGKSKYAQRNIGYIYKISDKETKDKLKYYLSEKVLFGGQKPDPTTVLSDNKGYAHFDFNTLVKNIQNNESIVRQFHGKEVVDRMKRLANIGKYMQSSGKYAGIKIAETGQATWALSQVIGFGTAMASGNIPGAMAIMFGPTAATATYLSSPVRNAISHGVSMPSWLEVGTKYGALSLTRSDESGRINKIQQKEMDKQ